MSTSNAFSQNNCVLESNTQPRNSDPNETSRESANAKKAKSKSGTLLRQQELDAWQPILTAGTTLKAFFISGLVFVPIGAFLLKAALDVREYSVDYTDCLAKNADSNLPCKVVIKNETLLKRMNGSCECEIAITVDENIKRQVFAYYGLTNFYANHRRYVNSRSDSQLMGFWRDVGDYCEPLAKDGNKTIVPCGMVADSFFNDTFFLMWHPFDNRTAEVVNLLFTDIAWASDKESKFKNPQESWTSIKDRIAKPPSWSKNIYDLENGLENESFIVWMRGAALSNFRKLHSRIDHGRRNFETGMPRGNYTITIGYNYPVDSFTGTKRFIIGNTSRLGGKNYFLGAAYVVVGIFCLLTGGVLLLLHKKFGKPSEELAMHIVG